jgi:surface polysaccharide O-acyltransferase-like enzyme
MPVYSGYIFLGAFLAHDAACKRAAATSIAAALFVLGVIATAYMTWYWSMHTGKPNDLFYSYSSPNVIVSSAGFFLAVRNLSNRFTELMEAFRRPIVWLSSTSFGVYLSHLFLLMYLQEKAINFLYGGPWLGSLTVPVFTVIACAIAVWLIQKIPIVRSVCPPS